MDNVYCHEEYCGLSHKEVKENSKEIAMNEILVIGGLSLFLAVISGVVVWYGAAHGIYVDLLSLN